MRARWLVGSLLFSGLSGWCRGSLTGGKAEEIRSDATTTTAAPTATVASVDCHAEDVIWLWKGALTSSSVRFKFGLRNDVQVLAKCVKPQAQFFVRVMPEKLLNGEDHEPALMAFCDRIPKTNVMDCQVRDLPYPARRYRYELLLNAKGSEGTTDNRKRTSTGEEIVRDGLVETPEEDGKKYDFRFVFGSCADELSDPKVFEDMANERALFFLHMGDIHYHDIAVNKVQVFRDAYDAMFTSPSGQAMMHMDLPFVYMWDDHDFGPDNSDRSAPGRPASLKAYREFVPHYPLIGEETDNEQLKSTAIFQAFTIGRVRFIITDQRSEQTPESERDSPEKTVLGMAQKHWFKEELLQSSQNDEIGLIVWCSTMPWNDDQRKWGGFTYEQNELVQFIQSHGLNTLTPIVVVAGDAHMVALDDGSHSPGNLTLFHAAAMGRPGSIKGGTFSHGVFPGSGQYGVMDVKDNGDKICLHFWGKNIYHGTLVEYDTCEPQKYPGTPYVPPPKFVRTLKRKWKKARRFVMFWFVRGGGLVGVGFGIYWVLQAKSRKRQLKKKI